VLDNLEFVESLKALPNNKSPPRIIETSGAALRQVLNEAHWKVQRPLKK
jgi:hypothetical protein